MPGASAPSDAESGPQIGQDIVAANGYTGTGTYVAILDSGVDVTRAAFGSCASPGAAGCKVEQLTELPNTADGVYDDILHGTNVAGIALSIAPGAKLLAWDVFDLSGFAQDADVTTAIDQVVQLSATKTIASANLSLAGKGAYYNAECGTIGGFVNQYAGPVAALRAAGVAPVFASGNTAYKDGSFVEGVAYPSCTPGAVRAGAVYDGDNGGLSWMGGTAYACTDNTTAIDQVGCFSQVSSSLPMVLAPGAMITAAGLTEGGTSMAAPHVAAAFAILKAARPLVSLTSIEAAILGNGPVINDARSGSTIQKHRLDLVSSLAAVLVADTTAPVVAKPAFTFVANTTVSTAGSSTGNASWSATDDSGIAAYQLQIWYDGDWHDFTDELTSPTSKSLRLSGWATATDYALAVAAQDGAGNWSDWSYSNIWRIKSVGEKGTGVSRSASGWTRTTWSRALGGRLSYSKSAGKWTKFTFIGGRRVAWVSTMASNRGVAKVYLNGTLVKKIDLRSGSTLARRLVYQASGLNPSRQYVLKIVVVGTSGRPRVDVDGFLVTN
jgi:subtilisin family serine protease